MGHTLALTQSSGRTASWRDLLNRAVNEGASSAAPSFNNRAHTLSGSQVLLTFKGV